jgi:hypothetical protein
MNLVAPDILADGQGLSAPVCGAGLALGFFLWLLGGWGQRFWLVLVATLSAGVYGLSVGERYGVQPLVAGLLLAVAAGALALSLVRVAAFAAGGVLACAAARHLAPGWQEPFVFFFIGGFLSLFLVRLLLLAVTSLAGALLMAYSGLWLLDTAGRLDAVAWAARHQPLLDWACCGVATLGFLTQVLWGRRRSSADEDEDAEPSRGWRRWGRGPGEGPWRRRAA